MIPGMTPKAKIAVTLPQELVVRARAAVRQNRAASVSAYVAAAMREKTDRDELAALLDELLAATGGPLTASERREADAALGR